jgi:nucleobase:cation symporter-1, NCS1 family
MAQDVVGRGQAPASDRPWSIETNGINPIPESERHGKPFDLFWVWCGANIAILGVSYGGLLLLQGLNVWQAIAAGVIGCVLSFVLVGYISLAGKLGSAPTLVLSRASFGVLGNAVPTLISYVSLVGWETFLVAIATLGAAGILEKLGWIHGKAALGVSFVVIIAVTISIGMLGHATIVKIQQWFTWTFAVLTVFFIGFEISTIDLHKVSALPAGNAVHFLGGVALIAAGLGIGWVNAGADYSRYLPRSASSRQVVWWTVVGASVAPIILFSFGALLAAKDPAKIGFAISPADLTSGLPTWFLVPYLISAAGGLIAGALLDVYSGGLNLLALGVRLPRYQSVIIDGLIMLAGNIYFLFVAKDLNTLTGTFVGFLITLGVAMASWSAIFLVDMWTRRLRQGYDERALYARDGRYGPANWAALISYGVALFVGLGTVTSFSVIFKWAGYILRWFGWDKGTLASAPIGVFIAFIVSGVLYAVLSTLVGGERSTVPAAGATTP